MLPRTRLFSRSRRRSNVVVASTLLTAVALATTACIPPTPPGPTTTTSTSTTTTSTTTTVVLPPCPVPDAPVLGIIDDSESLSFTIDGDGPVQVAVLAPGADPATAVYTTTDTLSLDGLSGPTRVLARSASTDCVATERFDATYDVRSTYAGRPGVAGSDSPAVAAADPSLTGWASAVAEYLPGADVTATFQTPLNAVGPYTTSVVSLGNGGSITLSFDTAITDGPGDDLAVFENGFYVDATSQLLFTELAYVEVSSNGTDFVRFDSASRRSTPVGAFEFQDVRELGGLAGKDGGGWGTPFDLGSLRNDPAVRTGAVDLAAITHVRIVDVVGANDYPEVGDTYPDSFGRQLFDTFRGTGSGGFDLRAIGALNVVGGGS